MFAVVAARTEFFGSRPVATASTYAFVARCVEIVGSMPVTTFENVQFPVMVSFEPTRARMEPSVSCDSSIEIDDTGTDEVVVIRPLAFTENTGIWVEEPYVPGVAFAFARVSVTGVPAVPEPVTSPWNESEPEFPTDSQADPVYTYRPTVPVVRKKSSPTFRPETGSDVPF